MKPQIPYMQLKASEHPEEQVTWSVQQHVSARRYYRCAILVAVLVTMLFCTMLCQLLVFPLLISAPLGKTEATLYQNKRCDDPCRFVLVESIPEGLVYNQSSTSNPSIFQAWLDLVRSANSSMDIASFYWTLTNQDTGTSEPSASQGEEILQELLRLPQRGVVLRIAVNPPSSPQQKNDIQALAQSGALVRVVDLPKLTGGVLHTKFHVVDRKHLFIGSANMDWRSLTQVKELGAAIYNCSCLACDLQKVFEAYWALGVPNASIPYPWPENYSTTYNKDTPLAVALNNTPSHVYLSSAPPALCAQGRTEDLQAIVSIIDDAKLFVYVAVMDYVPTLEFSHPRKYWPEIDDHLRKAVYERRVKVRLLISCWHHTQPFMFPFLRSLAAMRDNKTHYDIDVKLFIVPATAAQAKIPYARVNHNKYLVTDKVAYIGTSNWSGDYFLQTAGSALIVNQTGEAAAEEGQLTAQTQLKGIFERDWNSEYSREIGSFQHNKCKAQ
ncbi:phospholipase D3 [Rhinatrema bivittatum]|uniref:phospholipase D3 n=1 Tax=Rhinatrema bivittatum TaxID=194408 RepID=UPI001126E628|nr:phospholipase D3 [Rhinatrema bivittatum]XP_029427381.1 phospholipase D3 [Rhinatrema bivittatum]XP_029427383.1 phospholipase D3 [Rhinatrema bivittatum]XP_029427384.1 phospholipase D3 [Rhinatrema bivittatum]XP_029427385.1 phospholipase D3 [Rhinatrema bivittatum]